LLVSSTGLRYREIKTLRLRDLDLDGVCPTITLARKNTKNNPSARTVPLNAYAVLAASELVKRAKLLGANSPDHFLLPANLSRHTKRTDPLNGCNGYDPTRHQETWSSAWESLKKAAGLPNLRFHDLRHTFISHAREAGVEIETVMTIVGHISPKMTRYYTHLGSDFKKHAAAKVQQQNPKLAEILGLTPQDLSPKDEE
jgi:integrase